MAYKNYDDIIKGRIMILTQFGDALVYLVDDNQSDEIETINQQVNNGTIYEYIVDKYKNYPIIYNTILTENHSRYINPLLKIGFDVANSREKYRHASNNGLLNIIGVIFDVIANWDEYIKIVTENLKSS